MYRGFYTSAAGMLSQSRRVDLFTNNLANVNTPGYKADRGVLRSFPNYLVERLEGAQSDEIGGISQGVYVQETIPKFSPGALKNTDRGADLALVSSGLPINEETGATGAPFFTVQGSEGTLRYTRNGHFTVNGNGVLTTTQGFPVLDTNGDFIQVTPGAFQVRPDGTIVENGIPTARLQIAYAENPYELEKLGGGLFAADGELPPATTAPGVSYEVKQGFLEQSNVSLEKSMTGLMMSYRMFEANQKVLKSYDKTMEMAATKIGRVR